MLYIEAMLHHLKHIKSQGKSWYTCYIICNVNELNEVNKRISQIICKANLYLSKLKPDETCHNWTSYKRTVSALGAI